MDRLTPEGRKKANSKLILFEKGKSGNPKGRPRKLVNSIINELYEKGYQRVSTFQVRDCYMTMLNLTAKDLESIEKDKDAPMLMRIVARELMKPRAFEAVEVILQRAIGAPKQELEVTNTVREVKLVSAREYLAAKNDNQ